MGFFRLSLILGMCLTILSGCSYEKIHNMPIYKKSTDIMDLINQLEWEKAENEGKDMRKLFDKNKWKYQLLGDETEYSGLNQEISKLQISIEEQDKKEAKRNIVMIWDYVESIYFR